MSVPQKALLWGAEEAKLNFKILKFSKKVSQILLSKLTKMQSSKWLKRINKNIEMICAWNCVPFYKNYSVKILTWKRPHPKAQ